MLTVHFTYLDYFLFSIVFIVSIVVGLYFAIKSEAVQSLDEYFFGLKKLGVVPISFSLIATSLTGATIIGQSMEVYAFGLHNIMGIPMLLMGGFLVHYIFLPIFYELQIKSSFTYLELRFNKSVKLIASALFVITGFFFIPLTLYAPALSLQEVTGLNLYLICIVSGCICISYTAIGGFRAVVWTDVVQFSLMLISSIVILVVGLLSIGGLSNVWNALDRGERLKFFKPEMNLETRGSAWAFTFSLSFATIYNFNLTQSSIQRYLSLATLRKAKQALWIQCSMTMMIVALQLVVGAIIYATYEACDPLKAGTVKMLDQIFPHFVQEKASLFIGFNGIFIAGVFSAGLSTTSTLLNTMAGTIYVDFLSKRMRNVTMKNASRIMKILVAVIGFIGIGLIFIIERMGTILVVQILCQTISTVGVFGLFCNGMLFKNINSKGAKCGAIAAMVAVGILIIGSLKKSPDPVLSLRTDGCDFLNSTILTQQSTNSNNLMQNNDIHWIFRINFQFFCIIGLLINVFVGSIVSLLTGSTTVDDQRLLAHFLRRVTPEVTQENLLRSL